jgi:hypothetical protein
MDDDAYLLADAQDRRAALAAAVDLASRRGDIGFHHDADPHWLHLADSAYRWLRSRDTLRMTRVSIMPGTPYPKGTTPMATSYNLLDSDSVPFTLTGLDADDQPVPLPDGYSATWSLADPDNTGAVLTPSADNTSAVLSAGVPDSNLMVSVTVTVTNPDGSTSTYQGAEAVIVTTGPLSAIGIVPGTPAPKTPPSA